jgi:hypothetical protein
VSPLPRSFGGMIAVAIIDEVFPIAIPLQNPDVPDDHQECLGPTHGHVEPLVVVHESQVILSRIQLTGAHSGN